MALPMVWLQTGGRESMKCPKCGSEMEATTVCDLDTDKYVPVWLCHDSECDFCIMRGHEEKLKDGEG